MWRRRLRLSLTSLGERLASRRPAKREGHTPPPSQPAAVAVILVPEPESVLLIRRAERADDPWSGHIGLPGGLTSPADLDLAATAVRETVEEIGVALDPAQCIGVLDEVWPRTPLPRMVVVRPFLFILPERPRLVLSDEVAEAFWVLLADLREPVTYRDFTLDLRGNTLTFPAYHLTQGIVWGLTERILTPLLELIQDRSE